MDDTGLDDTGSDDTGSDDTGLDDTGSDDTGSDDAKLDDAIQARLVICTAPSIILICVAEADFSSQPQAKNVKSVQRHKSMIIDLLIALISSKFISYIL